MQQQKIHAPFNLLNVLIKFIDMNWNDISLDTFKRIEQINNEIKNDVDKVLFSVCAVLGITEYALDNMQPKKAARKIIRVQKVLNSIPKLLPQRFIGCYHINYNIKTLTFGQYIEIAYFMQDNLLNNAHLVVASCAKDLFKTDHSVKACRLLDKPLQKVLGAAIQIAKNFEEFNKGYKGLFGAVRLNEDGQQEQMKPDPFNKQYGWIFSATQVAEHERLTLDKTFELPVVQALNDLAYLKSKGNYL